MPWPDRTKENSIGDAQRPAHAFIRSSVLVDVDQTAEPGWDGGMLIRFGVVALLAINLISAGPTLAAGDLHTAAGVMPGCRNFLAGNDTSLLVQGMCFGEVTALFETFAGKCAPPDVAGEQLMRTVVEYIDNQPRAAERTVQSSRYRGDDEGMAMQAAKKFRL